ncbi:hypothetical protein [Microbulbifer pacificus]|uniref:Uncharacterized protein n=1 Tax=Microbulbifer pacificus TaxID=407164 RepID=A0AAU0N0Z6_9GAMM|nr:hypothetical protein [Microbulbifer pacificus]WOX05802.1 hypothetical protein R5R33_01245 [Microbulbifer pacificus]
MNDPVRNSLTCAARGSTFLAVAMIATGCVGERISDAALQTGNPEVRAAAIEAPQDSGDTLALDEALSLRIAEAELVAKVRITGVHRMIDHALSEPGMMAILGYVYSGVAEKVWKGESARLLAFRLTLDACDEKLHQGEQYLIFAQTDAEGRLQLASCEAAVAGAEAGNLLVQLDRYGQG